MSLIADGVLVATCLTTALYCLILSRRLRRLSDTGEGVGQQILRLNAALAETKAAVGEMRSSAKTALDQLEQDIEAAKHQSRQLQLQIARALKSGVGEPARASVPRFNDQRQWAGDAPAQQGGDATPDARPAAAAAAEDLLDEDLRAAEIVERACDPDPIEDFEEAESARPAVAQGADGGAFDEDFAETEAERLADDPGPPDFAPPDRSSAPARRAIDLQADAPGLLRVERMAV